MTKLNTALDETKNFFNQLEISSRATRDQIQIEIRDLIASVQGHQRSIERFIRDGERGALRDDRNTLSDAVRACRDRLFELKKKRQQLEKIERQLQNAIDGKDVTVMRSNTSSSSDDDLYDNDDEKRFVERCKKPLKTKEAKLRTSETLDTHLKAVNPRSRSSSRYSSSTSSNVLSLDEHLTTLCSRVQAILKAFDEYNALSSLSPLQLLNASLDLHRALLTMETLAVTGNRVSSSLLKLLMAPVGIDTNDHTYTNLIDHVHQQLNEIIDALWCDERPPSFIEKHTATLTGSLSNVASAPRTDDVVTLTKEFCAFQANNIKKSAGSSYSRQARESANITKLLEIIANYQTPVSTKVADKAALPVSSSGSEDILKQLKIPSHFEVRPNDVQQMGEVSSSSLNSMVSGLKVYHGEYVGEPVLVKVASTSSAQALIHHEAALLSSLCSGHIQRMIGCYFKGEKHMLLVEDSGKRRLDAQLSDLSWAQKWTIAMNIAVALNYLHSRKKRIIYGPFDSSRVFVDTQYQGKLADFCNAALQEGDQKYMSTRSKSSKDAPPELSLNKGKYSLETDIWFLGVLMRQLSSADTSGDDDDDNGLAPSYFIKLMGKCLEPDPRCRMSASDIVSWLQRKKFLKNTTSSEKKTLGKLKKKITEQKDQMDILEKLHAHAKSQLEKAQQALERELDQQKGAKSRKDSTQQRYDDALSDMDRITKQCEALQEEIKATRKQRSDLKSLEKEEKERGNEHRHQIDKIDEKIASLKRQTRKALSNVRMLEGDVELLKMKSNNKAKQRSRSKNLPAAASVHESNPTLKNLSTMRTTYAGGSLRIPRKSRSKYQSKFYDQ